MIKLMSANINTNNKLSYKQLQHELAKLQIYQVGGSVRDEILGVKSTDYDYVVVGSNIKTMEKLGFVSVGSHFPVFLHPYTKEEYALARIEKKVNVGYKGFLFDINSNVSLYDDLSRRDITINAIAKDRDGNIIDPFNGILDIKNKIIRHVSNAFTEDPLRILRVARFAIRFNFTIAEDTQLLMQQLANNQQEMQSIANERILTEFTKVLQYSDDISNFLLILHNCGVMKFILREFNVLFINSDDNINAKYQQLLNKRLKLLSTKLQQYDSSIAKFILIYYTICQQLSCAQTKVILSNALLSKDIQKTIILLHKLYGVIVNIDNNINKVNSIYLVISRINHIINDINQQQYLLFKQLIVIIIDSESQNYNINNIFKTIEDINFLWNQIDYKQLFINNSECNKKDIVYQAKMNIINNYLELA